VGLLVIVLRLAILPVLPIPLPFIPDDFSFLLAADTFVHGRLTNPTPAMWIHFESLHITMKPTYMSMYFPGPGLVLAAGWILLGHPWYGLLIANALMCAALCWMLQAWLPPTWALLGGFLAVIHISLFSYWINTYTGGGAIAALGGALLLGSLPRFMRSPQLRYPILMAFGVILLVYTRPYEGMLLCLPVAVALGLWLIQGKNRPSAASIALLSAAPLVLLLAAAAWLAFYDYRCFGNPFTLPYTIDRATYARVPYYIWQHLKPEPVYHHEVLRQFYDSKRFDELFFYDQYLSFAGGITQTMIKAWGELSFYLGFALIPPALMLYKSLRDRRLRLLSFTLFPLIASFFIGIFLMPHYWAPFTAVFYALELQSMRHLRVWKQSGQPVGRTMVRLCLVCCILLTGLRLGASPLKIALGKLPDANSWINWYGPDRFGAERAEVKSELERLPGRQLVIVRYLQTHNPGYDWVYNAADIEQSQVIWAREMDPASNQKLIQYYKDRQAWLVEPDTHPVTVIPYPSLAQITPAHR